MVRTESEFADRIRFIQQNHSLNEEAESLLNRYGEDFRTWFFDEFVSSIETLSEEKAELLKEITSSFDQIASFEEPKEIKRVPLIIE